MHVSLSVLEEALRFVEDLAETDPADLGARALPGLERLVRCDILSYNEFGPRPGQASYCAWPTGLAFSPASLAAFEAHVDQNPLLAHQRATGDDGPVKISDFLTRDRFHRLALYAEFYRDLPVEHQFAFGLPSPDGRVIGIALNRGRGDFTEADRDLLAVLRAPLARAMIRARSRNRAREALSGPAGSLTSRELQLLELVARGYTSGAIARKLQISPRTVAHHLDHIYRKLEVSSRAAAVYRAVTEGIVTPRTARPQPNEPAQDAPD
jgi:DNA-binding CsgD family transcriptional regulator